MRVRLLIAWNIYSKGVVIDPPAAHAEVLVKSGIAEYVKSMGEEVRGDAGKRRAKARAA